MARKLNKAQRASRARKAAVNRRVTAALKVWLRKHNPGLAKATHVRIKKTKSGFTVAGVKAAKNPKTRVAVHEVYGGYRVFVDGRSTSWGTMPKREAMSLARQLRAQHRSDKNRQY